MAERPEVRRATLTRHDGGTHGLALIAFGIYLALSVLFWGRGVLGGLSHRYVGDQGPDPGLYMWMLAWWPHALAHGLDPLITKAVWAPEGFDLAHATSLPGPSLVSAPLTALVGPVAAYNVWALLSPALAGLAAFMLCRHLTRSFWPSLAGGFVFGFSSYEVSQIRGHMNLFLVFAIPLIALLVAKRLDGSISSRWFVLLLAAALAGQFSISTEVFATMTLVGGGALLLALAVWPDGRQQVLRLGGLIGLAYAVGMVAVSPVLYETFAHGPAVKLGGSPWKYSADLLGFVLPTGNQLVGGGLFAPVTGRFTATPVENGAYLGIPLILATAGFARTRWRTPAGRMLLGTLVAVMVAALGPRLDVAGRASFVLPWRAVEALPLVQVALPIRVMVYAFLVLAVVVALWLASGGPRAWLRWGVVGLAVVTLAPNVVSSPHGTTDSRTLFENGSWRRYLRPGEIVLMIPSGSRAMVWQFRADFGFRLAAGYTGVEAPEFRRPSIARRAFLGRIGPRDGPKLRAYIRSHQVSAVVSDPLYRPRLDELLAPLHPALVDVQGLLIYRL